MAKRSFAARTCAPASQATSRAATWNAGIAYALTLLQSTPEDHERAGNQRQCQGPPSVGCPGRHGVVLSHGEFFGSSFSSPSLQVSGWSNTDSARNAVDAKTNLPRTQWSEMKGSLRNSNKRHVTSERTSWTRCHLLAFQLAVGTTANAECSHIWQLYWYEVQVPVLARLVQRGQLVNSIGPTSRCWTWSATASANKTPFFLRSPAF